MDERDREPHDNGLVLEEDEMRRLGYAAVDLIVERWTTLREDSAWAGATREEMEARFREDAPEEGLPPAEVMERAAEVMHYAGRIDHPRFFAFVPSSPTWPTLLADMLATGFNVFALVTARASRGHPVDAVLYHSDQAHSALARAARIAGFRSDAVRSPTDGEYRLDLDALRLAIRRDREAGLHPLLVAANGGTTNTGVVDPLRELGGLWMVSR